MMYELNAFLHDAAIFADGLQWSGKEGARSTVLIIHPVSQCWRAVEPDVMHLLGMSARVNKLRSAGKRMPRMFLQGLPAGSATHSFAADLLARIPQTSGAAPNAYKQQERAAAELARRNASYAMVLDEDEDDAAPAPADLPAPSTSKAALKKEKRMRKNKVHHACSRLCMMRMSCLSAAHEAEVRDSWQSGRSLEAAPMAPDIGVDA